MTYQLWTPTETQFCFLKQKMPFKNLVYMYLRAEKFNDAELTL